MSRIDFTPRPGEEDDSQEITDASDKARIESCDEIQRILADYLQPDSTLSLDEAIDQIAPLYSDDPRYMINFHGIVIDLADKIPYDHPSHKKLAGFVTAFCESDKWLAQSGYVSSFSSPISNPQCLEPR